MCLPKPEVCDGIDNNCNGVIDELVPGKTLCPMGGTCTNGQCNVTSCTSNADCPMGQICNPNGVCSPGVCMPTAEKCNGIDDDCNGIIDNPTPGTIFCPAGQVCVNGGCSIKQCTTNADCPIGTSCVNGFCK